MRYNKWHKVFAVTLCFFTSWLTYVPAVLATEGSSEISGALSDRQFPYEQCFTVTAYYSPLPDQTHYATGSYQSEMRLEGRGTNGASGQPVMRGIFAAPREIPYGTKIFVPDVSIEGFGVIGGFGAVYDRGGAIKTRSGDCSTSLDLWFGFGEKALEMTIAFGVRRLNTMVYGLNESIPIDFKIPNFDDATIEEFRNTILFFEPEYFKTNLSPGDSGGEVERLQQKLQEFEYYHGTINRLYDEKTAEAVFKFQTEFDVLTNRTTTGASHFGIATRTAMDRAIRLFQDNISHFPINLGKGAVGPNVEKLQHALEKLGYLPEGALLSGMYDTPTVSSVFQFQVDHEVIQDANSTGAGYFGPKTRATLTRSIIAKDMVKNDCEKELCTAEKNDIKNDRESSVSSIDTTVALIPDGLSLGASGENVRLLQEELARLGYFRHEVTSYYGEVTAHAIFKLQQAWKLLSTKNDPGAGIVGHETASKLNQSFEKRMKVKTLIASNRQGITDSFIARSEEKNSKVNLAELHLPSSSSQVNNPSLTRELDFGDRGNDVKILQTLLKTLGFFKGTFVTDFYGENTKTAVAAFQIARGIISSLDAQGAGRIGPGTLQQLQKM